jgi:hypothetical protein
MRVFAEKTYGIPPEQVIGTLNKVKFEMRDDKPVLTILPELAHWDDKEGKPVAIHEEGLEKGVRVRGLRIRH